MATKNDWDVRIGKRIAAFREAKGWSQAQLARECKTLSKSRIANYEAGARRPDLEAARTIAGVFLTSAAHLLILDNDQPVLSPQEAEVIRSLRWMPDETRREFTRRVLEVGLAHKPVEAAAGDAMELARRVSKRVVRQLEQKDDEPNSTGDRRRSSGTRAKLK